MFVVNCWCFSKIEKKNRREVGVGGARFVKNTRQKELNAKKRRSLAAQLLDHYHARSRAPAHFPSNYTLLSQKFLITSQRSHIITHLLDLRERRGYRNRRADVGMQSVGPEILPILPGEDVFVFRSVGRAVRIGPMTGIAGTGTVGAAARDHGSFPLAIVLLHCGGRGNRDQRRHRLPKRLLLLLMVMMMVLLLLLVLMLVLLGLLVPFGGDGRGVLKRVLGRLLRHGLGDLLRPGHSSFGGGRRLPRRRRQIVDERTPSLTLDLSEVARVDHEQWLVSHALWWFRLVRKLVLHAAVDVQGPGVVLLNRHLHSPRRLGWELVRRITRSHGCCCPNEVRYSTGASELDRGAPAVFPKRWEKEIDVPTFRLSANMSVLGIRHPMASPMCAPRATHVFAVLQSHTSPCSNCSWKASGAIEFSRLPRFP